jgi:23S rRNA pseudouridine1911/1915/1917 synthase
LLPARCWSVEKKYQMHALEFKIEEETRRNRLDKFLYARVGAVSRMYIRRAVEAGRCEVNGAAEAPGYHLKKGDRVSITIDPAAETSMLQENIRLDIKFEDSEIIVVDKPAGMLSHPTFAQRSGTLLNGLVFYLNDRRTDKSADLVRPGLVHRLDRETSGLMLIAKTARAHRILSTHFRKKLVEKRYTALVDGHVSEESGEIEAPIGRIAELKMWNVTEEGKYALTRYRVLESLPGQTLLELEPVTGRTNQLRIHLAYIRHPIAGDTARGGSPFTRLCLHATSLAFFHPNGGRIEISSHPPF